MIGLEINTSGLKKIKLELPDLTEQLKEAGAKFSENYKARLNSGRGVDGGVESALTPNPDWIVRLKGASTPLVNTGGLSGSVETTVDSKSSATIVFSSAYSEIASNMQFGGLFENVVLSGYKNLKKPLHIPELNVQARPHFFTTEEDRQDMSSIIWDGIRDYIQTKGWT